MYCNSTGTTAMTLNGQKGVYVSDWYNTSWNNNHEWTYYVDIPAGTTSQKIWGCGYGQAVERWEIHGGTGTTSPSSQLITNAFAKGGYVIKWSNLKLSHTHSYTKQVVDKQPTCTSAGSGHYECPTDGAQNGATYTIPALGHSFGSWSAWANSSNTEQKRTRTCSRCGKVETETRTRTYWNNINVNHPTKGENRDDGNCGWGYIKISNDGTNWSGEVTNENDMTANRTYGSRIYVKYIRPFYDYLEFGSITADGDIVSAGTNTWYHTVTGDSQSINIYMQYKHTTLTLDPNGGTINGNSSPQALSPQMQYSTSNWWDVSGEMPIRNGYTFEGWYDADDTKVYNTDGSCVRGTKYFDNNGNSLCVNDLTVYAHWKINTYNIYYTLYGSNASLQRTYTVESNNFALPTNPTLQGYTFKGWIGGIDQKDPVKKGNTYQTLTKNITISKGEYGDYFFRAIFEKTSSVDQTGNRTDNVYIAQSVPHEKQY